MDYMDANYVIIKPKSNMLERIIRNRDIIKYYILFKICRFFRYMYTGPYSEYFYGIEEIKVNIAEMTRH